MSWSYVGFDGVCIRVFLALSVCLYVCLSACLSVCPLRIWAHMRAYLYAGSVSRPEKNELVEVWLYK